MECPIITAEHDDLTETCGKDGSETLKVYVGGNLHAFLKHLCDEHFEEMVPSHEDVARDIAILEDKGIVTDGMSVTETVIDPRAVQSQ